MSWSWRRRRWGENTYLRGRVWTAVGLTTSSCCSCRALLLAAGHLRQSPCANAHTYFPLHVLPALCRMAVGTAASAMVSSAVAPASRCPQVEQLAHELEQSVAAALEEAQAQYQASRKASWEVTRGFSAAAD